MRRIAIGASLALGLTLGGASTAFAGEYTGQGDPIERGGVPASACSFSGQDQSDDFEDNGPKGEGDDDFATVPGKGTSTNPSRSSWRTGASTWCSAAAVRDPGSRARSAEATSTKADHWRGEWAIRLKAIRREPGASAGTLPALSLSLPPVSVTTSLQYLIDQDPVRRARICR